MEDGLAKIRPHTSSSLPNQKSPANLLIAVESTFKEQHTEATPTAYFAALLTTLDRTIQEKDVSLDEGAILPAELYLLALVAPFVPSSVIRTNLTTLLSLTAHLFLALHHYAPPLRSQLSLYQTIFRSLDKSQLEVQGVRQTFASTLQLCIDPRPKVRKKAVDLIKDLLSNPPTPLIRHPYSERVAEWVKSTLTEAGAMPFKKGKGAKHSATPGAEEAIHLLAFLKQTISNLPPQHLATITDILLTLPRLGNTYLSQTAYSILAEICSISAEDNSTDIGAHVPEILKILLSSPPPKTDHLLSSSWVLVLSHAMFASHTCNQESASPEVGRVWKAIWTFLDSTDTKSRKATAEALSRISSCFSPPLISAAVQDQLNSSVIRKIILQVKDALDSLPCASAMPELLSIVSSMIKNLQCQPHKKSPTAAEMLLMPLIIRIADLRTSKGFEYKEAADATLSVGIRVLGAEVILNAIPLNVEPESRNAGTEPRTFLLPLIAQHHPSSLSHFVSYFVPLSEKMFDWQQKAESEGRQSESKVWNVLIGQVWACLPGYCYCSPKLNESLGTVFSQLLSQLLYSQLQLRPSILKALKVLVDSNIAMSSETNVSSPYRPITPQEAHENVEFLRTQAESWLAVLLNVYGSVGREARMVIGGVIQSWMTIAGKQEASNVFQKVRQIFKSSHPTSQNQSGALVETTTAQDIFILLLPSLSDSDSKALFDISLVHDVLTCKDNGVQKRGYKILTQLIESGQLAINADSVLEKVDKMTDGLNPAAKKDRFSLLTALVSRLDLASLHIIPSLIPEAVLGTKEPSEKTRKVAFDLIITMGKKMCGGGVVKRSMVDGMDEDGMEDADASIEEFMTMVAGGLAGASPHMISATVTAISRLVFEFKDNISPNMHTEILTTMLILLTSANREIVKSVLGFVKLVIHTLPVELLRPHLKALVSALLNWSHDHKNHFKLKVRHIFERMMRRFNWEEIYACVGEEEEAAKVLINIKKRKDRAKRKKARQMEEGSGSEILPGSGITGDAFEDVLYGSEDESEGSENEESHASLIKEGTRLRLDDDNPMDLLDGVAVKVTNLKSNRRKQPGQDAARFKIDEGSGKMVIDENSDLDDDDAAAATNIGGAAYHEALTSIDGFTRGPNGRIKFNKDTKKRRREEDAMDVDACDMASEKVKKTKRRDEKFGHEFKAKRAGGDVKRGNVDPYAYMPLAQAAESRRKGRNQIGITGRR